MSKILGWVFDKVMHGPLARFEEANSRPFATQEENLRKILKANAQTEFGKESKFGLLATLTGADLWRTFRKDIPIRNYNEFLPYIDRMKSGADNILIPGAPDMFSLTSGTTAEPKFIPVNKAFIKEHHRQHLLWMYHVYSHHPEVNTGKYLVLASPAEMGKTPGGIPYGAMSGKQLEVQSIPVRRRMASPALVQQQPDPEERWFNLLLFALAEENLRVVTSVNPSSLVALADRMDRDAERLIEHIEKGHPAQFAANPAPGSKALASVFKPNPARARKLRDILATDGSLTPGAAWPHLEILLTWQGGSSAFYLPHVAALWGSTPMRCLGLRASEGTFSVPLADGSSSGVLAVGGHIMEFIPAEDGDPEPGTRTLLPGQLEEGCLYRLVVTTSGGLYRYDMGDLVRVTGFNRRTPEVAFERRAGSVLSATGEKLTEDQVIAAMERASANGPLLNGFTLTYEIEDGVVRYVLAVECAGGCDLSGLRGKRMREWMRQLLLVLDDELMSRNCEYQSKRDDGRIAPPRAVLLSEGGYERLKCALAAEGKPENQIKQPVMLAPPGVGRAPVPGCAFFDKVEVAAEF